MDDILNVEQMRSQFPSEWVLIGDPVESEDLEIIRGRVLFHSPSADAAYRKAVELQPGRFATLYTGETPTDMEYAL